MSFREIFPSGKPIIGMLHLGGSDPVGRALEELAVYEGEGVAGAIVENYHGTLHAVTRTLDKIRSRGTSIAIGVNILPNQCNAAYALAASYGLPFIQLDYVAGRYEQGALPLSVYEPLREAHPQILVLAGVWPKYYSPLPGSSLRADIATGMRRADALVVTGAGTGMETPLAKLQTFREAVGPAYPIIVGAGLTPANAAQQLAIADGAIVGSAFKRGGDTMMPVDAALVRALMAVVRT